MVQPGFKPGTSCSADQCFPNWANQAAVNPKHIFFFTQNKRWAVEFWQVWLSHGGARLERILAAALLCYFEMVGKEWDLVSLLTFLEFNLELLWLKLKWYKKYINFSLTWKSVF